VVDAVVKVGGRLAHDDDLPALCRRLSELGRRHRLLVVPGGGAFADAVRACDARFGLDDDTAHWMAILAMDQYGHLLGGLIPRAGLVRSLHGAAEAAGRGAVAVLLPYEALHEADPLPHSWAVTSDAIAAWVAGAVEARLLVLLKHRTAFKTLAGAAPASGAPAPVPAGSAPATLTLSAAEVAAGGVVDGAFPGLVSGAGYAAWLLDGGRPERLDALLEGGRAEGVRVTP